MLETSDRHDRRAKHVAALGLVLQVIFCGGLWGLSYWSKSDSIAVLARLTMIGIPIWLILLLVFHQINRVQAESLETEELKRTRAAEGSEGLFNVDDESLLIEQNRLRWMVRWMLPSVTIIVSIMLLAGQFTGWRWTLDGAFAPGGVRRTEHPTLMMWFVIGIGFLNFLYARYSIALARLSQWRVIRAGATAMTANAIGCLCLAIALMATRTIEWAEPLYAYVFRAALVVLGLEFAMNFILDIYRPRVPGEIARPSFDSRLLGLVTEPGGIAKSIASAINYQFGFEVSRTWFYELLQRWLLPITVLTILVIVALSSIVVVDAEDQAVVERFGRLVHADARLLEPGIHLKAPWPIDFVRRAPVRRVDELTIGESTETDKPERAILWTEQHDYVPELMLVVATTKEVQDKGDGNDRQSLAASGSESTPVSLVMVSVPIAYRIKNLHDFLYRYEDPIKLMENVAYQFLSNYAASVDIDTLMGPGRETFNRELASLIQGRLDELKAGIEITFVGVRGAHPPAKDKVAEAFESVIRAQIANSATINRAEGEAVKTLIQVAGTEARAESLDEAIKRRNALRQDPQHGVGSLAEAEQEVRDLLLGNSEKGITPPSGNAAAIIADARSAGRQRITEAANKVRSFETEVAAYTGAPDLYAVRKKLSVFENLGNIRRYLIAGDPSRVIVEWEMRQEPALDKVLLENLDKGP